MRTVSMSAPDLQPLRTPADFPVYTPTAVDLRGHPFATPIVKRTPGFE